MKIVMETKRLQLRYFTVDDAPFVLELVNDPSWIQFIGDRGIRTLAQAEDYLHHAHHDLNLSPIVAIVAPDNQRSIKLLQKLGLHFQKMISLAEDQPEIMLFHPAV